jgi:hypothetical protein
MKDTIVLLALLAMFGVNAVAAESDAPAAGTTVTAAKIPSASEALAAWDAFRADPLTRLDKTQPYLDFIRDSGQVHIVLNNDLLAWMYQPMDNSYKATLYAAFLGGNMAAQLAAKQSGDDDDVAGMEAALDAYGALRKSHPDFQLPLFETLAKARAEQGLARAVKNIEAGSPGKP